MERFAARTFGQLVGAIAALITAAASVLFAAWRGLSLETAAFRLVVAGTVVYVVVGLAVRLLARGLITSAIARRRTSREAPAG
ncbi:MAG: hypothetical protein R3F20_11760 [Planctomycetota bacterium]